jgi:hypothetical protein
MAIVSRQVSAEPLRMVFSSRQQANSRFHNLGVRMSTLAIMPHFEAVRLAWSISRLMAMSSSVARGGQRKRNSLISAVELLEGFTKPRAPFSQVYPSLPPDQICQCAVIG